MMNTAFKKEVQRAQSCLLRADGRELLRATTRDGSLGKRTVQWLAELPALVRPTGVAVRFPHIANSLALLWPTRDRCREYLDGLMGDRRGDRKGFPPDIARELAVLKKHHDSLVRTSVRNSWNDIILR